MTQRIAIIGSGIAGLACAWKLSELGQYDISLFEEKPQLGLGSEGVEIPSPRGSIKLDIPPRVINGAHYPELTRLIQACGASCYPVKQQPSFHTSDRLRYLHFSTFNLFGRSFTFPGLTNGRWIYEHRNLLLKWLKVISSVDLSTVPSTQTVDEWIQEQGYPDAFCAQFLFPIWSLMCSCQPEQVSQFPAADMLALIKHFSGSHQTLRVLGGISALESQLIKSVDNLYLNKGIRTLTQSGDQVYVHFQNGAKAFDHVIIATEPNVTAKLIEHCVKNEFNLLNAIPVRETQLILHTDEQLMPKHKKHWSAVNCFSAKNHLHNWSTVWMNKIESKQLGVLDQNYFLSWEPAQLPDESKILAQRTFMRTLLTPESARSVELLKSNMTENDNRRVWYAGTYMGKGVPLLETAVASSSWVAGQISHQYARRTREQAA